MNHRSRKVSSSSSARKKKQKEKKKKKNAGPATSSSGGNWVETLLTFEPVVDDEEDDDLAQDSTAATNPTPEDETSTIRLRVVSWNVLAQAYCSRKSQCHLPRVYQKPVFDAHHRQQQILELLTHRFAHSDSSTVSPEGKDGVDGDTSSGGGGVDVLCLQEVDVNDIQLSLETCGYKGTETPRVHGGGAGGRVDSCGIYVNTQRWQWINHELIRLDDLATLSSNGDGDGDVMSNTANESAVVVPEPTPTSPPPLSNNNLQGLQQSFLRRNMALLVRIQHKVSGQTVVIANCHLYWHPGYEYVKLCQAHYIAIRAQQFCQANEPLVWCGDFNSKPGGAVHSYLTNGTIRAKQFAPWYRIYDPGQETETIVDGTDNWYQTSNNTTSDTTATLIDQMKQLELKSSATAKETSHDPSWSSSPRYLLDATLNKLCRWLRILGQDTALETDEEEKLRTGEGKTMILFDRCRNERRTLVTTSIRLQQRTDCPPGTYVISPTYLDKLETALVHLLLTHGVVLEPETFLSRCVICNGSIQEVEAHHDKHRILQEYQAPIDLLEENLEVYQCNGCQQGYWWCDRPTSSASRVKGAATRLFELCIRAGVPIRGSLGMFEHVNVEELRQQGWDNDLPGSELLQSKLDVIEWLRHEQLKCPFPLQSAYARHSDNGSVLGEVIPFTNVTHGFVNTLDYIFHSGLKTAARLKIPRRFPELNPRGIENGHLLPSDIWPSDHLCIGASLFLDRVKSVPTEEASVTCSFVGSGTVPPVALTHGPRCACGCVPNIPSLFEMAELRKKAKQEKASTSG